jgi:SPP1 gp7 family putative phage head morphogenesis protein
LSDNAEHIALTPAEIAALREAIKQLQGTPYADALYSDMEALVEAGWTNAKQLLHLQADLDNVKPSMAMDALRKHVDDFTFMVNQREQDYLNQLLDRGLSEGWTPKKLSSEIAQAFSDGYHIKTDTGEMRVIPTDTWADTVARTELSRAQIMGTVALYEAAGIQKVMYVTTQGGNVCDICSQFDGQTYALDDAPEIPQHPNCCCAYMAADEDVKYQEAA